MKWRGTVLFYGVEQKREANVFLTKGDKDEDIFQLPKREIIMQPRRGVSLLTVCTYSARRD